MTGDLFKKLAVIAATDPSGILPSVRTMPISDVQSVTAANVFEYLALHAFKSFEESTAIACDVLTDHEPPESAGKAFYRFSVFCDELLKLQKADAGADSQGEMTSQLQRASLAEKAVTGLLGAMRTRCLAALERVPRIFSLLAQFPSTQATFKAAAASVPIWAFLPWISQMISCMDSPEGPAIADILAELARVYPQAVYFPMRISRSFMGPQGKRLTDGIAGSPSMQLPQLEAFVDACELLQHPEHRLKDWIAAYKLAASASASTGHDRAADLRRIVRAMVNDCLDPGRPGLGELNVERATMWRKVLLDEGEAQFKALVSNYELDPKLQQKLESFCASKVIPDRPTKLHAYSSWMASYHVSEYGRDSSATAAIEVPGQYGRVFGVEPRPELHVCIASFEEDVLVMGSLRLPKRIGVLASDQTVRRFLVKGGEDLRLDERVMSAFTLFNGLLARDVACSAKRLRIGTYNVVPMTHRAGLIEWVDGTRPFKEMLEEEWAL
jgi:DNA-dependent protein kinase catalytic subunit